MAVAASVRPTRPESFLAYRHYRYLGIAGLLGAAAIVIYVADRPFGTRYGGTWAGYTLGIAGAALILWLTWFGYRKRSYVDIEGSLAKRLSAHVYLGFAVLVIVTLHTGFHFGWNVHTLAYALMCVVIASGLTGVYCYVRYPRLITANRAGMTMQQMLGTIATLDEQLRVAAMPLDEAAAMVISRSIETDAIGNSTWRQVTEHYPHCTTAAAITHFDAIIQSVPSELEEAWSRVRVLLDEKASLLRRVRKDLRYKALIDVWLYWHVPVTFMLLAALLTHIFSIFFLW
jgi:hypothetical protein